MNEFYWVKFYTSSSWQLAKIYKDNNEVFIKGIDWASPGKLKDFTIVSKMQIFPPEKTAIYISGPITGMPENNRCAFDAAAERLRREGWSVVSPMDIEGQCKTWEEYMRHDLRALLGCDAIYLLEGWEKSRGATLEHRVAVELGLAIEHENTEGGATTLRSGGPGASPSTAAVCEHGHLARSCEVCEKDARISELETQLRECPHSPEIQRLIVTSVAERQRLEVWEQRPEDGDVSSYRKWWVAVEPFMPNAKSPQDLHRDLIAALRWNREESPDSYDESCQADSWLAVVRALKAVESCEEGE